MFCPKCGYERTSDATSFCSKCGYLLSGTAELFYTGGELPDRVASDKRSPRSRGLRMGLFMVLLMFIVAPIMGFISMALGIEPWPVGIAVALLGGGGLLRMAYSLLFEPRSFDARSLRGSESFLPRSSAAALPPQSTFPAGDHSIRGPGSWRETHDLEPGSVTERTTRHLKNEREPPAQG